jgi:tetratricopeptide (TPR) repeat protein
MPRLGLVAVALSVLAAPAAFAAPEVLVVQRLSNRDGDFNVPVGQRLVEELDVEGRVSPILWSMLDPVFRAYIDDGKLPGYVENPDEKTIRDYASRLKVAYVLIVEAVAHESQVVPQASLYRGAGSRPIWSMVRTQDRGRPRLVVIEDGKVDEEKTKAIREKYANFMEDGSLATMTVLVNGQPDWESMAHSLARTWTRILAEGPFSQLEPQHRTFAPPVDPGLGFGGGNPTPNTAPEAERALELARVLAADGHLDQAILLLRDAVDAAPFTAACRLEMARLMLLRGHAGLAAAECERGAALANEPGELWALAADAWVQAGEPEKALNAANEARARGVTSPELLQTLGDVWLLKDEVAKAIQHYDEAIALKPSARAHLGRSLARAIGGDQKGSIEDLGKAQGDDAIPIGLYQQAMGVLDREFLQIADRLKFVPQGVRIQGGADMVPSAETLQKRASAIVEILVRLRVPARHKQSHEGRDLAYKLLAQCAIEVLAFAKSKDEDAAMEAAISLGEALKLLPRIEETFRLEQKYGLVADSKN